MYDVAIIHPGAQDVIYGDLSNGQTAIEPPTWARMITGWLRDRGFSVRLIDQEAEGLTAEEVAQRVGSTKLAVVVVFGHQPSASTQQMVGACEVVNELRSLMIQTLMVGNHVSALPERTLLEENAHYVCDGEGPVTIMHLITETLPDKIPGLVWATLDGQVHRNPRAELIPIDGLHGDVWDLLPMEKYRAHVWQCLDGSARQPYASIYTTLGCPFKCSFCMINVFQHANLYRRRDPVRVVNQIKRLYRFHGVKTLKIADEMFVLDPRHYIPICEKLASQSFAEDLNIWAYARVDTVKPETLNLMRRAGIRWLALGIESASSTVRDGADKHLSDEDIYKTVKAIQHAGISVIGNFIYGLPDDTMESMRATLNLAKSLDLDFANHYACMAYPGSGLFGKVSPSDLPDSWAGYSQHSYESKPLPTATLSSADVLRFRDDAFYEYFTDERYLNYVNWKFGYGAVEKIQTMASNGIRRKLLEVA